MGKVLVTGGMGFIGSHTVVELLEDGQEVVIADNLSNSKIDTLGKIEKITGKMPEFIQIDVSKERQVDQLFSAHTFSSVIHFASFKSVSESILKPIEYYQNNLNSILNVVAQMLKHNVATLIFSSSATVYGSPCELPLKETSKTGEGLTNPYGRTKYMIEQVLEDISVVNPQLSITLLRYFNPIGAHESGLIGESPNDIPNNLMPHLTKAASGESGKLSVFGADYETADGTCIRDFIHVVDLAKGHLQALAQKEKGVSIYNLGTGKGVSVLELIHAFESATDVVVPYEVSLRRPGDIVVSYANVDKAREKLGWVSQKTLEEACRDAWRFQLNEKKESESLK